MAPSTRSSPPSEKSSRPAPFFLLDVRAVVLVVRTRAGEGDLVVAAVLEEVLVDELRSVEFLSDVKRWSAFAP